MSREWCIQSESRGGTWQFFSVATSLEDARQTIEHAREEWALSGPFRIAFCDTTDWFAYQEVAGYPRRSELGSSVIWHTGFGDVVYLHEKPDLVLVGGMGWIPLADAQVLQAALGGALDEIERLRKGAPA